MKPIKAFIPMALSNDAFFKWCQRAAKNPDKVNAALTHFIVNDPSDHEWTSFGLTDALEEDRLVHDLDGKAFLLRFKFNNRILPAVVRDQEIAHRINELQERKGDAATKQEYAQIRDDVESALLPKAFIRPSYISALVYKDRILFCTSSARRLQDMAGLLVRLMDVRKIDTQMLNWTTQNSMSWLLGAAARDDALECEDGTRLYAGDAIVLKSSGEDKRTVRFKDREVSHAEVQQVVNSGGYMTTEIRMEMVDEDGDIHSAFNVTTTWIFKAIKLELDKGSESLGDQHATHWYYAVQFQHMLSSVLEHLVVIGLEGAEEEKEL